MTTHKPTVRCPSCGRAPNVRFSTREVHRARRDRQRARIQDVQCTGCRSRYWIQARHIAQAEMEGPLTNGHSTALPSDFPERESLVEAGVRTLEELEGVADLTALPGIGPAKRRRIHEALDGMTEHHI